MYSEGITYLGIAISLLLASRAHADTTQSVMDKPHPVFSVPMGIVLLFL